MSYLDKLMKGVEVRWKTLGEVVDINTGQKPPIITDIPTCFDYINAGTARSGYCEKSNCEGDTVTTPSRGQGGIGYVAYQTQSFWLGPLCYKLKSKDRFRLLNKYLFYYLQSEDQLILNLKKEGGVPAVNKSDLASIPIPIPCPENKKKSLEIQKEIVRILDSFTELIAKLTAELTAELTSRKKQYSYYREQLFSFDEKEVHHLPLGDDNTGKFIRGSGLQKKDFTNTGVGCIHYGQIYTYYGTYTNKTKSFVSDEFAKKSRKAKQGDLVIATTSENDEDVCKAVAWLGEEDIAVSSDACFYTHNLNPKYVAYFFQTEQFQRQKRPFITGAKVRRVNADDLAKIKIPVPSLGEQARIADILDKFDTLTASISESLPKEIALRKKQYEYYRDLLLTFPKEDVTE